MPVKSFTSSVQLTSTSMIHSDSLAQGCHAGRKVMRISSISLAFQQYQLLHS